MSKGEKKSSASTSQLSVIILAAGKGTRMVSPLPKVLHPVAGRPMIERVINCCKQAGATTIRVVVGHGANLVQNIIEPLGVQAYMQVNQLGTADAVKSAQIDSLEGDVLILNGDHPLLSTADIESFWKQFKASGDDLAVVTAKLKTPGAFGRIVRYQNKLRAIVEAKDASADTLKINEVNTGIYFVKAEILQEYLPKIGNFNAKKEFYLTDLISLTIEDQMDVGTISGNARVAHGVNNQSELSKATRYIYRQKTQKLMDEGVLILDPASTYVEDTVTVGVGSVLYPNVFLRGHTTIGSFSVIEPNCFISDCKVGDSVQVKAGSYLEKSAILNKASVGPYARLRPETEIGEDAHVGNFVEMKKVKFGAKSKAGHLTYLGDAEIGTEVNIGCGTITCNYAVDRKKYKTKIGNRVFVGSDSQFIAPITIGDDVVIGSGSTITKDVPARALAVARGKQFIKEEYVKVEVPSLNADEATQGKK